MEQTLILNIIPFTPASGKKTFAFYREKKEDYYPIVKGDLQAFNFNIKTSNG